MNNYKTVCFSLQKHTVLAYKSCFHTTHLLITTNLCGVIITGNADDMKYHKIKMTALKPRYFLYFAPISALTLTKTAL